MLREDSKEQSATGKQQAVGSKQEEGKTELREDDKEQSKTSTE